MTELDQAGRLQYDAYRADDIRAYFEPSFARRSFNPLESELASAALQSQLETWRAEGSTIVFTSGCYDLFHANHRTYLLHTKLAASPHCWGKLGCAKTHGEWVDQLPGQRADFSRWLLESDILKLVVSVDGNASVAARKGFNTQKGGSPRPVYDWRTRSRDVLSSGFELKPGLFKSIVDAVTLHDNVEPSLEGTPHAGIMEIGKFVKPDVWSVFHESDDIIEAARVRESEFEGVEFCVLEGHQFYSDLMLGGSFSTTSITRRLGDTAASNGGVA